MPQGVDPSKSICDCKFNEQVVQCNATSYDNDLKSVYKDEFSVDRVTGKMTTNRTSTYDGQITRLELGEMKCTNANLKF